MSLTLADQPTKTRSVPDPAGTARRFEMLPVNGDGAIHTTPGARGQGSALSPAGLTELISSIARHGVLQPLLVEEIAVDGAISRRLVAGERRLRACRIGVIDNPDNPHFQRVPAVVVTGPLSPDERCAWSISENLSREDLPPGRLAAALLNARAELLLGEIRSAGITAPQIPTEDPVARWGAVEKFRAEHAPQLCAPWAAVLRELGISFGPRKARLLVAAFKALPAEVSSDMDAHQVALVTRTKLVKAAAGQGEFAEEIWAAVKGMGRPELLAATSSAISRGKQLNEALSEADAIHAAANEARRLANAPAREHVTGDQPEPSASMPSADPAGVNGGEPRPPIDGEDAMRELRALVEQLERGAVLERYTVGSLQLLVDRLQRALGECR